MINKLLEKLKNLDEETNSFWDQISKEYYDFELAEQIKELTKQDMVDFFKKHIDPASPERAKVSVWMIAQATHNVSTKQISEFVKALELHPPERESEAVTEIQARLSAVRHGETEEIEGFREYLLHDLKVAEENIDTAAE
ncbi:hypothetical protein J7T55_004464, partial [Diaporthe amygdali]|uniref:uncharacterized protein n=1 Tax=Phomopsis amygdali TaxID=1214568 RepID=UPI0022FE7D9F